MAGSAFLDSKRSLPLTPPPLPASAVEMVNAPLLVVAGARDPRCPRAHADRIVEGLRRRRGEGAVEYVCYDDEGHGIRKEKNVLDMYGRVERFLARHLDLPEPQPLDRKWTQGHSGRDL